MTVIIGAVLSSWRVRRERRRLARIYAGLLEQEVPYHPD
jgi:hypothetical protein